MLAVIVHKVVQFSLSSARLQLIKTHHLHHLVLEVVIDQILNVVSYAQIAFRLFYAHEKFG